nr:NADH dehydrogenase subunit 3 [Ancistrocerus parietum]
MINFMILSILPIFITFLLILINYFFSLKSKTDREKPSPFECGFNPLTNARLPFSMQFFIIGIMFLIFDIEIIILIPLIPSLKLNYNPTLWFNSMFFILMILFLGLYYEWNENSITWMN